MNKQQTHQLYINMINRLHAERVQHELDMQTSDIPLWSQYDVYCTTTYRKWYNDYNTMFNNIGKTKIHNMIFPNHYLYIPEKFDQFWFMLENMEKLNDDVMLPFSQDGIKIHSVAQMESIIG